MSNPQTDSDNDARVIRFRPRGAGSSGWRWPVHRRDAAHQPVRDLTKFERTDGEDDYRHRMTMNALTLVVTTILVCIGLWLATSIAEMRRNQDCFLQGHRNCNNIVIPPRDERG